MITDAIGNRKVNKTTPSIVCLVRTEGGRIEKQIAVPFVTAVDVGKGRFYSLDKYGQVSSAPPVRRYLYNILEVLKVY